VIFDSYCLLLLSAWKYIGIDRIDNDVIPSCDHTYAKPNPPSDILPRPSSSTSRHQHHQPTTSANIPIAPRRCTTSTTNDSIRDSTSRCRLPHPPFAPLPGKLPITPVTRSFATSSLRKSADHGHESHYDQPTGWLFGVKPGEKAEKEGWEGIWYWGFYGSFALATVAYAFKPDTRYVQLGRDD
jgi:hypothetical protein